MAPRKLDARTGAGVLLLLCVIGVCYLISADFIKTSGELCLLRQPAFNTSFDGSGMLRSHAQNISIETEPREKTEICDLNYGEMQGKPTNVSSHWNTKHDVQSTPAQDLLSPELVPNTVLYVWCGQRWFHFRHYMSVLSVIKTMRPDNLLFFYENEPINHDAQFNYDTWFEELKESYAFFMPLKLAPEQRGCQESGDKPNLEFIQNYLHNFGGIYVNENTIFNEFPLSFRNYSFIPALNDNNVYSFISSNRSIPLKLMLKPMEGYKTKCISEDEFNKIGKAICISSDSDFFPKDIWTNNAYFAKLIRCHMYGSSVVRKPIPNYDTLVPNIAHMIWIGGGEMDFLFYMCVNSLLFVVEVENVYIHGDLPPSGLYWDRVKNNPKLKFIYRPLPRMVFGTEVNLTEHITDVWRVDFMIKYGGIYIDTDATFVRSLGREIRGYDAVGAYDWTDWNKPFPDTINFGIALGKRNAKYWHLFQQSMKWFKDLDWSWNGLRQPYKILERHPELVKIDPHLQVICFQLECHPTWWPNYHDASVHHLSRPSITDWRQQAYAYHWTTPTPPELQSFDNLLKSNTMFADMGRYIFTKAGILQRDNKTVVYPNGETVFYPG